MIYVENTTTRVMGMGNCLVPGAKFPKVVRLMPGVNKVERKYWDVMAKNPMIQKQIEAGYLKVALDGEAADKVAEDDNLLSLPSKEALKLVSGTYDRSILTAWHNSETRPVVIKAIAAQLKSTDVKGDEK